MRTLTPRQRRFVAEYRKDGDERRAYLTAGYSPRSLRDNLRQLVKRLRVYFGQK